MLLALAIAALHVHLQIQSHCMQGPDKPGCHIPQRLFRRNQRSQVLSQLRSSHLLRMHFRVWLRLLFRNQLRPRPFRPGLVLHRSYRHLYVRDCPASWQTFCDNFDRYRTPASCESNGAVVQEELNAWLAIIPLLLIVGYIINAVAVCIVAKKRGGI